jgi:hypothetical protein
VFVNFVYAVNFMLLAAPIFSGRWNIKIIQDCIVSVAYVNDPNSHIKPGVDIIILATKACFKRRASHVPSESSHLGKPGSCKQPLGYVAVWQLNRSKL